MKTFFITLFAFTALSARAQNMTDGFSTALYCRDAGPIMDAGLIVNVTYGQLQGTTHLVISEQSIMGPRPVGTVIVSGQGKLTNGSYVYVSHDIVLTVDTTTTPDMSGQHSFQARIIGSYGKVLFAHDLICRSAQQLSQRR